MNLRDYEWFHNPRGLHNGGPGRPFVLERYTRPRLGWAKLVAEGDEYVDAARQLIAARCMPIICLYRPYAGASPAPAEWYPIYLAYLKAGCRWFECYEEPNNPARWPQRPDGQPLVSVNWQNATECIQPLMDSWLDWAERIIDLGGYPAFPALAESDAPPLATVYWLDAMLRYLKEAHAERFLNVVGSGLWCATHPYLLNRFYQEPPDGPRHAARPLHQQRGDEPGWHFEYPYDPLIQSHDPGRTVFGATPLTPYGAPNGLISSGEAFQQLLKHHFGVGPVPAIGTAGGITPIPLPDEEPLQPDALYPPYDRQSHAEATLALMRWIATSGPPWLFGLTLSDEAEYYEKQDVVPAVERLAEAPPILKEVPSLETGGTVRHRPAMEIPEAAGQEVGEAEAEALAPSPIPPTPEGVPDWLTELDFSAEEGDLAPSAESAVAPEEDVPDWLAELEPAPGEAFAPLEAPASTEEELPDWLGEALGISEAGTESAPLAEEVEEEVTEEVPDWLAEAGLSTEAEEVLPAAEEEGEAVTEEVPDWLSEITFSAEEEMPITREAIPTPPAEAPVELEEEGEVPAWLAEAIPTAEEAAPQEAEPAPAEPPPTRPEGQPSATPQVMPSPTAEPDHHWLLMAIPGFEPRWFFLAGRRYWEIFRPTIVTEWSQVHIVPPDRRVAVTILVAAEMVGLIEAQVRDRPPNVQVDLVPVASLDELRAELDWRAVTGRRLG